MTEGLSVRVSDGAPVETEGLDEGNSLGDKDLNKVGELLGRSVTCDGEREGKALSSSRAARKVPLDIGKELFRHINRNQILQGVAEGVQDGPVVMLISDCKTVK